MSDNIRKRGRKIGSKNLTPEQRADLLRRRKSKKDMRDIMKTRNYWTKEVNQWAQEQENPLKIIRESKEYSIYRVENIDSKSVEDFLNENRSRVLRKLSARKKVNYTLKVSFIKFDKDGKKIRRIEHIPKAAFLISNNKSLKESYDILTEYFLKIIEEKEMNESGWQLEMIYFLDINIGTPVYEKIGCAEEKLPYEISNRCVFPLLKSDDNKCFKWAVSYSLFEGREKGKITEELKKFSEKFNWEGFDFPIDRTDFARFEKQNKDYLIFCYSYDKNEKFSIYYKNKKYHELQKERKTINLLLYDNHVFPIENEKLFYREVFKSREKTWVCKDCFSNHSSEDNLKIHQEYCQKEFQTKDEVPDGGVIKFTNYQAQMQMPYVCYIDSEAKLESVNIKKKKTIKYEKHFIWLSFCE